MARNLPRRGQLKVAHRQVDYVAENVVEKKRYGLKIRRVEQIVRPRFSQGIVYEAINISSQACGPSPVWSRIIHIPCLSLRPRPLTHTAVIRAERIIVTVAKILVVGPSHEQLRLRIGFFQLDIIEKVVRAILLGQRLPDDCNWCAVMRVPKILYLRLDRQIRQKNSSN